MCQDMCQDRMTYLKAPKECAQRLPAEALHATHSLLERVGEERVGEELLEELLNGKHAEVV